MKNYTITVNGNVYDVVVEEGSTSGVTTAAKAAPVARKAPVATKAVTTETSQGGSVEVKAGAAGKVFKIEVKVGQNVKKGDTVIVIEAMKMEIPVVATEDGTVASINVSEGEAIEAGALLATLN